MSAAVNVTRCERRETSTTGELEAKQQRTAGAVARLGGSRVECQKRPIFRRKTTWWGKFSEIKAVGLSTITWELSEVVNRMRIIFFVTAVEVNSERSKGFSGVEKTERNKRVK